MTDDMLYISHVHFKPRKILTQFHVLYTENRNVSPLCKPTDKYFYKMFVSQCGRPCPSIVYHHRVIFSTFSLQIVFAPAH